MRKMFRGRKAQTTAEYAILIGVVVMAIIGMQTYLKRGLQGRYKDASDDYISGLSTSQDWGNVSSKGVTAYTQYEHGAYSSVTNQDVAENEDYYMQRGGNTTWETTRTTRQKAGDYHRYDYEEVTNTNSTSP